MSGTADRHLITVEFTAPQWVADIAFDVFCELAHDSLVDCDPAVSLEPAGASLGKEQQP